MHRTGWIDVHAHFALPGGLTAWDPLSALDHMVRLGIDMQLLSDFTVTAPADVRASNEYGASVVRRYPSRFGLLAALPLSDVDAALAEIDYAHEHLGADGFALCATYDGDFLGAERFRPVWRALDAIGAGVLIHPSPFGAAALDLPRPFFEVTFDTARTVVDMVWRGVPRSAPDVRVVLAHAGGALPALAGRIALLSDADWVPHEGVTPETVREAFAGLYYDTAMAATPNALGPALAVTSPDHIVYGSDFGAPCASEPVLRQTMTSLLTGGVLAPDVAAGVGRHAHAVFPRAAARLSPTEKAAS
ncbi:amidohydrolase family protein [Streptomyces cynarae]|uniref:amidohydrolase family protein n=1 Tax=Streptomyces cynarae TaxID=2981134 RepID=UPI00406C9BC5